jgi:hypothetical protein
MDSINVLHLYDAFNDGDIKTFTDCLSKINESKNVLTRIRNNLIEKYNKNNKIINSRVSFWAIFGLGSLIGIFTSNYHNTLSPDTIEKYKLIAFTYTALGLFGTGDLLYNTVLSNKQHDMILSMGCRINLY